MSQVSELPVTQGVTPPSARFRFLRTHSSNPMRKSSIFERNVSDGAFSSRKGFAQFKKPKEMKSTLFAANRVDNVSVAYPTYELNGPSGTSTNISDEGICNTELIHPNLRLNRRSLEYEEMAGNIRGKRKLLNTEYGVFVPTEGYKNISAIAPALIPHYKLSRYNVGLAASEAPFGYKKPDANMAVEYSKPHAVHNTSQQGAGLFTHGWNARRNKLIKRPFLDPTYDQLEPAVPMYRDIIFNHGSMLPNSGVIRNKSSTTSAQAPMYFGSSSAGSSQASAFSGRSGGGLTGPSL
jgi:hypothetical protein